MISGLIDPIHDGFTDASEHAHGPLRHPTAAPSGRFQLACGAQQPLQAQGPPPQQQIQPPPDLLHLQGPQAVLSQYWPETSLPVPSTNAGT